MENFGKSPMLLMGVAIMLGAVVMILNAYNIHQNTKNDLNSWKTYWEQYYKSREELFQLEMRINRLERNISLPTIETEESPQSEYEGQPPKIRLADFGLPADLCDKYPPFPSYTYNYSEDSIVDTQPEVSGQLTLTLKCTYFRVCADAPEWCELQSYATTYPDVKSTLYIRNNTVYNDVFNPFGEIDAGKSQP